ncbi:zinc finger protein 208-like [Haliotis rubra]|uniref:zinc finger protein 208-like n=1 Tax=Haliotis rubra TaxID=36100 RepID=UPI001EE63086|nr:zinc finger protein 208-like [Haliotis rubra]
MENVLPLPVIQNIQIKIEPPEEDCCSTSDCVSEERTAIKQEPLEKDDGGMQQDESSLLNIQDVKLEDNRDQENGVVDAEGRQKEESGDNQGRMDWSDEKPSEQDSLSGGCSNDSEGDCGNDNDTGLFVGPFSDPESDSDSDLPSFQLFLGLHQGKGSDEKNSSRVEVTQRKLPIQSQHGHNKIMNGNKLNKKKTTTSSMNSQVVKTEAEEEEDVGLPVQASECSTEEADATGPSTDCHQLNHIAKQELCFETFNTDVSDKDTQLEAAHGSERVSKSLVEESSSTVNPENSCSKSRLQYETSCVSSLDTKSSSHSRSPGHKSKKSSDLGYKHDYSSRQRTIRHHSSDNSKQKRTSSQGRHQISKSSSQASPLRSQRGKSIIHKSSTSPSSLSAAASGRSTSSTTNASEQYSVSRDMNKQYEECRMTTSASEGGDSGDRPEQVAPTSHAKRGDSGDRPEQGAPTSHAKGGDSGDRPEQVAPTSHAKGGDSGDRPEQVAPTSHAKRGDSGDRPEQVAPTSSATAIMISETEAKKAKSSTNVSKINTAGPSSSAELNDNIASNSETFNAECFRSKQVYNAEHPEMTEFASSSVQEMSPESKVQRNMKQQPYSNPCHKSFNSQLQQPADQSTVDTAAHSSEDDNNESGSLDLELKPECSVIPRANKTGLDQDSSGTPVKLESDSQGEENVQPFSCHVCLKSCASQSALNHHLIIHRDRTFKCGICNKAFYSTSNLTQHMTVHTGGKPVQCNICGKTLSCQGKMKVHMRSHTGEKPYECTVCGKWFTVFSSLKSHQIIHNNLSIKCEFCDKVFKDPKLLARHVKVHGERKFYCDVCGKPFKRSAHLKVHIKIHTGQKDFKCYVCSATFAESHGLKTHMVVHTGRRSHKCHVCGDGFSQFHNLMRHLKIHTGAKPYKCDVCQKEFADKVSFNLHMNIHTGQRPYSCKICDKTFVQPAHLRNTSKGTQRTKTFKGLRAHNKRKHPAEEGMKTEDTVDSPNIQENPDASGNNSHSGKNDSSFICDKNNSYATNLKKHISEQQNVKDEREDCDGIPTEESSMTADSGLSTQQNKGGEEVSNTVKVTTVSSDQSAELKCNICKQSFTDICHLKKHKRHQCHTSKPEKQMDKDTVVDGTETGETSSGDSRETLAGVPKTQQASTKENNRDIIPGSDKSGVISPKQKDTVPDSDKSGVLSPKQKKGIIPDGSKTETSPKQKKRENIPVGSKTGETSPKQKKRENIPKKRENIPVGSKTGETSPKQKKRKSILVGSKTGETSPKENKDTMPVGSTTGDTPTKQSKANAETPTQQNLFRSYEGTKQFSCDVCKKFYSDAVHLEKHKRKHTEWTESGQDKLLGSRKTKRVSDDGDSKDSPMAKKIKLETFAISEEEHTPTQKNFSCTVCDKSYSFAALLERHMKKHSSSPLKCDLCGRTFSDKSHLKHHKEKHHKKDDVTEKGLADEKVHKCDVCEKVFIQKISLEKHMNIHVGAKPYKCVHCDKCFGDSNSLKVHTRRHIGEKSHVCEICNKAFYEKTGLTEHLRIHTGERPFKCTYCDHRFSDRNTLKHHLKIHTGSKPYSCDKCQSTFRTSSALKSHQLSHSEERPFKCDICEKSFKSKVALDDHTKIHIGDYPFKCEQCDKAYTTKAGLNAHTDS